MEGVMLSGLSIIFPAAAAAAFGGVAIVICSDPVLLLHARYLCLLELVRLNRAG